MASTDSTTVVAVACGGTGGHFYPGLTIAQEIQQRGARACLFIAGRHIDEQVEIAGRHGIDAVATEAVSLPAIKLYLPAFSLKLLQCILANVRLLRQQDIDRVIGMGSFASAPIALAAVLLRLPLFIHEGNSVLGRANRLLSRWATTTLTSFPNVQYAPVNGRVCEVGMPIRDTIVKAGDTEMCPELRKTLCLRRDLVTELPIVLVFGGSQGARRINEVVAEMISKINPDKCAFQVMHITGKDDNESMQDLYESKGIRHLVKKSEPSIEELFMIAEFAICRSGASTIFELMQMGKPAIYIPFPYAMDNHQVRNADYMVTEGAGFKIEEHELTASNLHKHVQVWLDSPEKVRNAGECAKTLAKPRAVADIAKAILG